jgi:predicted enzyme related to lactoylglutathione lyase
VSSETRVVMRSNRDVIIQSENLDAAKAFYRDALGFELTMDTDRMVGFETGSFQLFVERGISPQAVFEYEVDDLDEARAKLLSLGCAIVEENPSVPRIYLRDPFGLVFNITQR